MIVPAMGSAVVGAGFVAFIIIVIIALIIVVNCIKIVPQAHAVVSKD